MASRPERQNKGSPNAKVPHPEANSGTTAIPKGRTGPINEARRDGAWFNQARIAATSRYAETATNVMTIRAMFCQGRSRPMPAT